MKKISFVLPIYNEEGNIALLHKTLIKTIKAIDKQYVFQFVYINDGSRDNSLVVLKELAEKDRRIKIINFARNFGHQLAVTAGLDYAEGDAVIIMDTDLQDPPSVCLDLIGEWEKGYDVIYAQRRTRKDSAFKKLTANIYYRLLKRLADIDIPRNTGDFRLLDRRVVNALNKFREHDRFLRGLVSYVGFKQKGVLFDRDSRHSGKTNYPFKKMMKLASDGLIGFSDIPIRIISRTGYLISFISFAGIVYALVEKIFFPQNVVSGWTFIIIAVLFIGGIQLILLGVIGNYIGRIYTETQNRPLYIIESITSAEEK